MALEIAIKELGTGNPNTAYVFLPANTNEVIDAMDKAKIFGEASLKTENCEEFPELNGFKFTEEPTLDELNFLAKRFDEISGDRMTECTYRALLRKPMDTISEAINRTYNLDTVAIYCCQNYRQYGGMVIDNCLLEELEDVPDEVYDLLDPEKVGRLMAEREDGVFMDGYYVTTNYYQPALIYNDTLPEHQEDWIFRLKITGNSENTGDISDTKAQILTLPTNENCLREAAERLGEKRIEDCDCVSFESAIPYVTNYSWDTMEDVNLLNAIAKSYSELTREDAAKFKAVLEFSPRCKLDKIADIMCSLDSYEFDRTVKSFADFGEKYLSKMLPPDFDKSLLNGACNASFGDKILRENECLITDYGAISKQGGHLYAMVESPECEEIQSMGMSF